MTLKAILRSSFYAAISGLQSIHPGGKLDQEPRKICEVIPSNLTAPDAALAAIPSGDFATADKVIPMEDAVSEVGDLLIPDTPDGDLLVFTAGQGEVLVPVTTSLEVEYLNLTRLHKVKKQQP